MMAAARSLAIVAVLALCACGRSEPPAAAPAPATAAASASDDRVKNVDSMPAAIQPAVKTLNAADHVDDTLKAQKEALDRKVDEQTK